MKIYNVSFSDGGWFHGDRLTFTVVAESTQQAIEKVLVDRPKYKQGFDVWAVEFKIEGYVIEVYDEKTYKREKNLENLI